MTLCLLPFFFGCAMESTATSKSTAGAALEGNIHGGSQPVVGAHVHLIAAAATGYGAAANSRSHFRQLRAHLTLPL